MMQGMCTVEIREAGVVGDASEYALLDAAERERAGRRSDPRPFVTAHALQRRVVGTRLGIDPRALAFERRCATCGSDRHGKPNIVGHPGWSYSLSYTSGLAVVALTEAGPVGVDVEQVRESDFAGFAEVTLAADEVAGFAGVTGAELLPARAQVWARKESVLKATGHGLVVDPSEVVVTGPAEDPALLDWRATQAPPGAVRLADVPLADAGHRAAVAVLTGEPLTMVTGEPLTVIASRPADAAG